MALLSECRRQQAKNFIKYLQEHRELLITSGRKLKSFVQLARAQ